MSSTHPLTAAPSLPNSTAELFERPQPALLLSSGAVGLVSDGGGEHVVVVWG
jgi:hypothetical protein